jgi:hypothetical protein
LDGGKEFVIQASSRAKTKGIKNVKEIHNRSKPSEKLNNPMKVKKRSRARNAFWRVPPNQTPPANPNPCIPKTMEKARKSLPAAAAKDEFLRVMEEADKQNKVVLVTGETGCGKVSRFTLNESIITYDLFLTNRFPDHSNPAIHIRKCT